MIHHQAQEPEPTGVDLRFDGVRQRDLARLQPFHGLELERLNAHADGNRAIQPGQLLRKQHAEEQADRLAGLDYVKPDRRLQLLDQALRQDRAHAGEIKGVREKQFPGRLGVLEAKFLLHDRNHRIIALRNRPRGLDAVGSDDVGIRVLRAGLQHQSRGAVVGKPQVIDQRTQNGQRTQFQTVRINALTQQCFLNLKDLLVRHCTKQHFFLGSRLRGVEVSTVVGIQHDRGKFLRLNSQLLAEHFTQVGRILDAFEFQRDLPNYPPGCINATDGLHVSARALLYLQFGNRRGQGLSVIHRTLAHVFDEHRTSRGRSSRHQHAMDAFLDKKPF